MLLAHLRVFYLHGFASGPASRKARFFAGRLAALGVSLQIPDLAQGRFEQLTISGQLDVLENFVGSEPAILIGSSLGGYLAALYAAAHPAIQCLLLLAPAFGFYPLWCDELGPARMREWRENGTMSVFHYAEGRDVPLGYQLMEDASRFPEYPDFHQPALIFHGTRDSVVPLRMSTGFIREHPNARLVELESDHELTDALDRIWPEAQGFLLDLPSPIQC